jgi:hypothetical protein
MLVSSQESRNVLVISNPVIGNTSAGMEFQQEIGCKALKRLKEENGMKAVPGLRNCHSF